jgi:hypothetical protein
MAFNNSRMLFTLALLVTFCLTSTSYAQQQSLAEQPTTERQEAKLYGLPVERLGNPANQDPGGQINPPPTAPSSPNSVAHPLPANSAPSAGDKLRLGLKKAYFSPLTYLLPVITTVRQETSEEHPAFKDKGDKFADGLSRYGINFLTASTKQLMTVGVYPAIFRQNPHYIPSGKKGIFARSGYALKNMVVTYGDSGDRQFNASLFAGNFTTAAMANIWERNTPTHHRIGVGPTFRRFGSMVLFDAIRYIVLKEFGSDIKRLIRRR